jgi:hypothetical protein
VRGWEGRRRKTKKGEGGVGEKEGDEGRKRGREWRRGSVNIFRRGKRRETDDELNTVAIDDDRTLLLPTTTTSGDSVERIDRVRSERPS